MLWAARLALGCLLASNQRRVWLHQGPGCLLLSVRALVFLLCSGGHMRHRLHNWCQEDSEVKKIMAAQRPDAAFDAALFDSLQEHDPADLIWTRVNNSQPQQIIFNPSTDGLLFMRGDMRAGFRSDLVGGKRKEFTQGMETRSVKRPKHSADAARARRYGE